jgi:hypothetical protein
VGAFGERGEDGCELAQPPPEQVGGQMVRAIEPDVLADTVRAPSLTELSVVRDQRCSLVLRINRQRVI